MSTQRIAAGDQQPGLAIGREVHVAGLERHAEGAAHRLLAHVLHVERRLALALGHLHAGVEGAQGQHVAQALQQLVVAQQAGPRADRLALAVEHANDRIGEVADVLGRGIDLGPAHLSRPGNPHVAEIRRAAGSHCRRRHVEGQGSWIRHGDLSFASACVLATMTAAAPRSGGSPRRHRHRSLGQRGAVVVDVAGRVNQTLSFCGWLAMCCSASRSARSR